MTALFRFSSAAAYAIFAACNIFPLSKDTVDITGEFFADGTCRVAAEGVALFAPSENARYLYRTGITSNVAPEGYTLHQLNCGPLTHPMPNYDLLSMPQDRVFSLSFSVKGTEPAATGTYAIERIPAGMKAPMTMAGGYSDPQHYGPGTKGAEHANEAGHVWLLGVSGTASFTRLDSAGVVGKFHFQATREWSF